jgi:hypothetical protein
VREAKVVNAFVAMALAARLGAQTPPPPAGQNPSPMVEATRAHERLTQRELAGVTRTFTGPDNKPVELFIPEAARRASEVNLVVHFLGLAWIPELAVSQVGRNTVVAVLNLGAGSGVYDRAFSNPAAFDTLLATIGRELAGAAGKDVRIGRVTLSGFSAGHGAVRAILREPRHFARVDEILLMDGMHTAYVPEGVVLEKGGALDPRNLEAFIRFAELAVKGDKRFLITHSEIFPGTFASTTETVDYLLKALGLKRTPVLEWGPRGMQQLSEVRAGHFELMGFAGNSAPGSRRSVSGHAGVPRAAEEVVFRPVMRASGGPVSSFVWVELTMGVVPRTLRRHWHRPKRCRADLRRCSPNSRPRTVSQPELLKHQGAKESSAALPHPTSLGTASG